MDEVFKALADPTRRELLDRLRAENGQTLGQLCRQLAMSCQAVTKHPAILEGANLVVTVWRGRDKLHYLDPTPMHGIYQKII
jgi:DNA-binding transcriptional ArsR family regulator